MVFLYRFHNYDYDNRQNYMTLALLSTHHYVHGPTQSPDFLDAHNKLLDLDVAIWVDGWNPDIINAYPDPNRYGIVCIEATQYFPEPDGHCYYSPFYSVKQMPAWESVSYRQSISSTTFLFSDPNRAIVSMWINTSVASISHYEKAFLNPSVLEICDHRIFNDGQDYEFLFVFTNGSQCWLNIWDALAYDEHRLILYLRYVDIGLEDGPCSLWINPIITRLRIAQRWWRGHYCGDNVPLDEEHLRFYKVLNAYRIHKAYRLIGSNPAEMPIAFLPTTEGRNEPARKHIN
jgi:hypothetical protein